MDKSEVPHPPHYHHHNREGVKKIFFYDFARCHALVNLALKLSLFPDQVGFLRPDFYGHILKI